MLRVTGLVLLFLTIAAVWLVLPLAPRDLGSRPRPAGSYAEAVRLVGSLSADDSLGIAPECRTELLTHGVRTAHVIVLLHGLTN